MFERLKKLKNTLWCHRSAHLGLAGAHLWAAIASGKPEVYLPMAGLYLWLVWMG